MPHLLYLAWGYPPAAKSCAYRMLATANSFARKGWDVTVVTLTADAWLREHGLDDSLLALVDERIEVVRLPLYRDDLDTDIRSYSRLRAQRPKEWLKLLRRGDQRQFPELVFGRWRNKLVAAAHEVHERKPVDLVLASASPYTFFAPALDLNETRDVPFVLDYRDAWAIDIIGDKPAFQPDSRKGRIERKLMDRAQEAWFVNQPIRDSYAQLYPEAATKLEVVRNGSDLAVGTSMIPLRQPDPADGLTFGYLGTVSFTPAITSALCDGWRLARQRDPLVAASRLEFRGHIGAGAARGASGHVRVIAQYANDGVSYEGPVAKGDTADVYASWDALVLALVGGRYVTSGKVYDYVSTGLPVMSAHEPAHAAAEILDGYPLWVRNEGMDAEQLAKAFIATAHMAVDATVEDREKARQHAAQFERYAQIEPAVDRISTHFQSDVLSDVSSDGLSKGLNDSPSEGLSENHTGSPSENPSDSRSRVARQPHTITAPDAAGRKVVLAYTASPLALITTAIEQIRKAGGQVTLVGPQIRGYEGPAAAANRVVLLRHRAAPVRIDPDHRPMRYSPQWASVVARNLWRKAAFGPARKTLGVSTLWWLTMSHSREALHAIDEADVVTALDAGAVYSVWECARRNRHATAINGIGPTMEHLRLAR